MPQIIKDPLVEDNIRDIDTSDPEWAADARRLYEDGCLIILRGKRLDLDYAALNALDFDIEGPKELLRKIKKYEDQTILSLDPDALSDVGRLVFEQVFQADRGRLRYFQDQVRSGDDQIIEIYRTIFPNYREYKSTFTWRFTETLYENLHWDNFATEDDFHQVRVFCNVDRRPRLWRTSHNIERYADEIYKSWRLDQWADQGADRLTFVINNKVLGGMENRCLERLPKHHIAFEQGDIWLAETRLVSHQIYAGQRAIASMFYIDPASMDDPSKSFGARMASLHTRHRAIDPVAS
jgi:hypothetical protein